MPLHPLRTLYTDSEVAVAEHLLRLLSPNQESAVALVASLHDKFNEKVDYDAEDFPVIWAVWRVCGFSVDWKDDESMEAFIEQEAHRWGLGDFRFPPGFEVDTAGSLRIPLLMHWARHELASHGLLLWHWYTDEDNYCGAICREADWPELLRLCNLLEVEALPGDEQFESMP